MLRGSPSIVAVGPTSVDAIDTVDSSSDAAANTATSRSRSGSGVRSVRSSAAVLTLQVRDCDSHMEMQGPHMRMHASGMSRHASARRNCLQTAAAWSTRHSARLHAGLLLSLLALLLLQLALLLPHSADPTAAALDHDAAVESFDVQLRRNLQAAFVRVPPQRLGIGWRPMLPLSLTTLANPEAYTHSNVPRSQWPPVLACGSLKPEVDMWTTLAPCLLGTYFAAQTAALPNLLHFFNVQPGTIDCHSGRYVDVEPDTQTADANSEQLSPGMMLQSYLSLMSLSVASSTRILHSSPHPWWRWQRQEKRSDWKWQFRQVDEDDNTTLPIQRDTHVDVFDLGDFLQFNQVRTFTAHSRGALERKSDVMLRRAWLFQHMFTHQLRSVLCVLL